MGPTERLALSWGNARQFTKLLLSLLSHIGVKMACRAEARAHGRIAKLQFWIYTLFPEVPFCEDVTGTAFQELFEMLGLFNRLEHYINLDLPWHRLGRMETFLGVMVHEPLPEVCGMTNVTLTGMAQTLDHVCVEHGLPSIAWNPNKEKSSFT